MIIDLIAGDSFGRYNRKLAKLVGLQTAVYWSEILNIITRVVKKSKYDEEGFFEVKRDYVEKQCTLKVEEQLLCDQSLRNLGILDIKQDDVNRVRVDLNKYAAIVIDDNETDLKKIAKAAKVDRTTKAEGKKAGIINRLFSRVKESDPELLELYRKLIEACYSKGMQTNAQIDLFQEELNKYTADKSVKKELLMIGVSRGYKVFEWCSSIYEKDHKVSAVRPQGPQVVATELNEDIKF